MGKKLRGRSIDFYLVAIVTLQIHTFRSSVFVYRYCAALYEGLKSCPKDRHIHVICDTDFIAHLIGRAEPELAGGRRERHARTIDIAQEEVDNICFVTIGEFHVLGISFKDFYRHQHHGMISLELTMFSFYFSLVSIGWKSLMESTNCLLNSFLTICDFVGCHYVNAKFGIVNRCGWLKYYISFRSLLVLVYIYGERLHRLWQKLRAEEQTWQMLFYLGVEALRKSFEVGIENHRFFYMMVLKFNRKYFFVLLILTI